jgi:hypothetical protein
VAFIVGDKVDVPHLKTLLKNLNMPKNIPTSVTTSTRLLRPCSTIAGGVSGISSRLERLNEIFRI